MLANDGPVPRTHRLEDWERLPITGFAGEYLLESCRRLAFRMLDADAVAV